MSAELRNVTLAANDMAREIKQLKAERDRYRLAWQSARFRAQAYGEGIVRITGDRESYQGWLKQEQAETQRLRTELAKYVGAEPTIAEEMAYLSRCLTAVHDLCDETAKQAGRWEHPLPVPEWVEDVCKAASGERPDNPADNRRRIYIDGKGNGWIDLTVDPETGERDLTGITSAWKISSADAVRTDTGGLREIGRCS